MGERLFPSPSSCCAAARDSRFVFERARGARAAGLLVGCTDRPAAMNTIPVALDAGRAGERIALAQRPQAFKSPPSTTALAAFNSFAVLVLRGRESAQGNSHRVPLRVGTAGRWGLVAYGGFAAPSAFEGSTMEESIVRPAPCGRARASGRVCASHTSLYAVGVRSIAFRTACANCANVNGLLSTLASRCKSRPTRKERG